MAMKLALMIRSGFLLALINVVFGSYATDEKAIREMLLKDYDKTVRPAGRENFTVDFGAQFMSLTEVNSKDQTVTVHMWVVMKWINSFFSWNISQYNVARVHFTPDEIWFPDIALYNNADPNFPMAGGPSKFISHVIVDHKGECVSSGPVTFTAECATSVRFWPFDKQRCNFHFSSFSYDSKHLSMTPDYSHGHKLTGNSNWKLDQLFGSENLADRGNCCPYKFSQVTYTMKLMRRYDYQMFYIFAPVVVLIILALLSFFVPSESGERIGYVTTLLLSLMVYLLVVPDSLPVSSKEIPILGIMIMVTLAIIGLVLLATILVLFCFHRIGTPPRWLCHLLIKKDPKSPTANTIQVKEMQEQPRTNTTACDKGDKNQGYDSYEPEMQIPNLQFPGNQESPPELDLTWQLISFKLDKLFFWMFSMAAFVSYIVMLVYAWISARGG